MLSPTTVREPDSELLLAEMRHRLANVFQLIDGLVRLRLRTAQAPETREALTAIQDEIASLGLLHQLLATPEKVSFGAFLRLSSMTWSKVAEPRGVTLDVEAEDEVELPDAALTSLALVAHELMTNCLEHAYAEGRGGRIAIEFRPSGDGFVTLTVSDDGKGFAQGDGEGSVRTGHLLVTRLVKGMGGSFEIAPRAPSGTTARAIVPVPARRRATA